MTDKTIEVSGEQVSLKVENDRLELRKEGREMSLPCSEVGLLIVDTPRARYTHDALVRLIENGAVVVLCDRRHLPATMLVPLVGNSVQTERTRHQIEASKPSNQP